LLEEYGDGLALIEPAFTLADDGTGRLYTFPVGFAPRLEVHERQLAGLLSSRASTGPTGFEDYACEMLGSPLESVLAFLGMPALTTTGRDSPAAWAVRSVLLRHSDPVQGLLEMQRRLREWAAVQRELRARQGGLIGSPVDPLGPRHAYLVECLARGEHEATEAVTRAEMAVIDAAYWEGLCARESQAAKKVRRAELMVAEAEYWLRPTVWGAPPVPTLDPKLKRLRGGSPPSLERPETWDGMIGDHDCDDVGDAYWNSLGVSTAPPRPVRPEVPGYDDLNDVDWVHDVVSRGSLCRGSGPSWRLYSRFHCASMKYSCSLCAVYQWLRP